MHCAMSTDSSTIAARRHTAHISAAEGGEVGVGVHLTDGTKSRISTETSDPHECRREGGRVGDREIGKEG